MTGSEPIEIQSSTGGRKREFVGNWRGRFRKRRKDRAFPTLEKREGDETERGEEPGLGETLKKGEEDGGDKTVCVRRCEKRKRKKVKPQTRGEIWNSTFELDLYVANFHSII